jgi:hypothetical protein
MYMILLIFLANSWLSQQAGRLEADWARAQRPLFPRRRRAAGGKSLSLLPSALWAFAEGTGVWLYPTRQPMWCRRPRPRRAFLAGVLPGAKADAFRRTAIHAAFLMEHERRETGVLRLRPVPAIAASIGAADPLRDDPLEAHFVRLSEHTSAPLAANVARRQARPLQSSAAYRSDQPMMTANRTPTRRGVYGKA